MKKLIILLLFIPGNIYFSYIDTSWPPNEKINTNQNKEGLKMSNNIFK
jgi:hypothetical protein